MPHFWAPVVFVWAFLQGRLRCSQPWLLCRGQRAAVGRVQRPRTCHLAFPGVQTGPKGQDGAAMGKRAPCWLPPPTPCLADGWGT